VIPVVSDVAVIWFWGKEHQQSQARLNLLLALQYCTDSTFRTAMPIPMDVDPVDDDPRPSSSPLSSPLLLRTVVPITREEEARQAIELLRGNDMAERVAAAHRLDAVAAILGEERTRNELLPFLSDAVDDEDEVLLAMAQALGRMIDLVGGPTHAESLFLPLELLLSVEETTVRQAAAESTLFIASQLSESDYQSCYAKMIARLATQEWFTARISAVGLLSQAYTSLRVEQQKEHLEFYANLAKDDTPMVRRVAAQYLGQMVQNVVRATGRSSLSETGSVVTTLLPIFEEFSSNEQPDSVRLQTTENCVAFGQVLSEVDGDLNESEQGLLKKVLPLILATIDDRSWRVRWTTAAKFSEVISAYGRLPDVMDSLVQGYEKLLQDPEAEVRTAATFNLAHVAKGDAQVLVPPQHRPPQDGDSEGDATDLRVPVAERLVKRVTSLTEDESEHVRAALAMVATELAPILGREGTITFLVPPVLLLLRDAASEVRLNLISSLSALNEVIGVDLLSQSLLPAILDLAQDGKWRIRMAIIQLIPLLAKQLGQEFVSEKLASLCVEWLGDDIATIRQAAASNIKDLTALFGTTWATEFLLPSIVDIRENESYLRRLTALQACSMMATEMDSDSARIEILPLILEMATDLVPNIRFNVAKELQSMAHACGISAYESQVLPVLNMLLEDEDRDVRFYAEKAATALDETFAAMDALIK
jgi:serine/threonine-protein phosphatase 2A regulatory subunit A